MKAVFVRMPDPGESANPSVILSIKPLPKSGERVTMDYKGKFLISIIHPNTKEVLSEQAFRGDFPGATQVGRALQADFKYVKTTVARTLNAFAQRARDKAKARHAAKAA